MNSLETIFINRGGQFTSPIEIMHGKAGAIKALVFDWDGVFNDGYKYYEQSSTFSEIDSMGTNLLRFSYWLITQKIPVTAIITGADNHMARYFTKRERFDFLFLKCKNKRQALDQICKEKQLIPEEVAFFFDDVLDLDVAELCGLRLMARRNSSPLFENYVLNHGDCDYMTGSTSNKGAVREACELIMGLLGNYDTCIDKRRAFKGDYETYLNLRNKAQPAIIEMQ